MQNFAINVVINFKTSHIKTNRKYLIAIVGPTAIGKTALSIKLAQYFDTEILSADSRQFFREMTIGTAAPSENELMAAKHHFIHHKSIQDHYNVGQFEKDALKTLKQLFETHDVAILVGGSGLYIDAVTKGLDEFPRVDKNIRESLNQTLRSKGLAYLQEQLKERDLVSYETIAIDNPHRVIRALEICIGTGQPYASFLNKKKNERPFQTIYLGLTAERHIIYERVEKRVDAMINSGLLDEVKKLYPSKHLNALNTVGYKELFLYLEHTWDWDFAVSEIKKNTRRFAKRQQTWFKRTPEILWVDHKAPVETSIVALKKAMGV